MKLLPIMKIGYHNEFPKSTGLIFKGLITLFLITKLLDYDCI